jgi:serine/threonine-protein kinase
MQAPKGETLAGVGAAQWPRVKAIFYQALDRPAVERTGFIEQACHGDPALQRMIESLLASDRSADGFMEAPAAARVALNSSVSSIAMPDVDAGLAVGRDRGPNAAASLEIQTLLRYRLRIIVIIALVVNVVFNALRFLRTDFTPQLIRQELVPAGAFIIVLAVFTAILWRRRTYALSQLRWLESVLFATATVYYVGETYGPLFADPAWLVEYAQRHPTELSILARQPSVYWMAMIIIYGTFVPNTGRRCAAVTMAMALSPLLTITIAGWHHPSIPPRALFLFVSEVAIWLAMGVAIAIYGSHKITVLREEALAARKLGQYQLKRRLGQGGMGEVYLAEHMLLKRPCAVKVIRPDQAGDPGTLQRFLREVQVTATLTHPNTIQVFDYGQESDGTVFYAMEYLTGLSLEEFVGRYGRLPPQRAIFLLRQLCGALAEAHGVGLIHRDIKPSNVIVCSRGGIHDVVKLLDFGLARMESTGPRGAALTQAGLIFGTPAYMSPEQASGHRAVDGRSDIYSLGALGYFLTTGEPPFVRDTVAQTLAAHLDEAVIPLRRLNAEVPPDFENAVMRSLAKDPDLRFADIASLDRALDACRTTGEWTQADAFSWWSAVAIPVAAG